MNARFASRSLRIRYVPIEGTLMIDPDTVRNLELVASLTHKKSTHSLFGYVFLCSHYVPSEVTNEGCSTILILQWRPASCEPISYHPSLVSRSYRQALSCLKRDESVQDAINARLDFVEGMYGSVCFLSLLTQLTLELICSEDKFTDIRDALKAFKKMDFDKLVASVSIDCPQTWQTLT